MFHQSDNVTLTFDQRIVHYILYQAFLMFAQILIDI
jgi:hypothetical protein